MFSHSSLVYSPKSFITICKFSLNFLGSKDTASFISENNLSFSFSILSSPKFGLISSEKVSYTSVNVAILFSTILRYTSQVLMETLPEKELHCI